MTERTPPAERLLNLIIALVNTPGRLTRDQVRRGVVGYDPDAADDAFERMFERDKDTLRELGVPLVTVTDPAHGDEQGYRIDHEAYALPPVTLTAQQVGVLALAADLWRDQTLAPDARRALTKLRALATTPGDLDAVAGLVPRLRPGGPGLAVLLDAVTAHQAVTFTYRAASTGELRVRRVEPWLVTHPGAGWYVVGHDLDRGEARVFRLSRIVGKVRPVGEPGAYEIPADADATGMVAAARAADSGTAVLVVAPERALSLRARAVGTARPATEHPGWDRIEVPYAHRSRMVDDVVAATDAVVVLEPPGLRADVVAALRAGVALAEVGRG